MIGFNPVFVNSTNLDDCWFTLLKELKEKGRKYFITDGSYAGQNRLAFDFVSGVVRYPHDRPLAPFIGGGCNLPPPTTEEEIEKYFVNYLMDPNLSIHEDYRYSTFINGGLYHLPRFAYGEGLRVEADCWPIIVPNQVQWIINHFKKKGHGNEHCYLTVGYPESNLAYDLPYSNPNERKTSPCLRGLDFRIIDGYLTTHVVYRSWDLGSGFPTNMGGFTLLNEYVAGEVGVNPGPLTFSCKSLHVYEHFFEYLRARVG